MPDEVQKVTIDPVNILKIVILAGAVIGLLSLFLAWFSTEFLWYRIDYAGYDFYFKGLEHPPPYPAVGYYAYMPFVVFAAAAAAAVCAVFAIIRKNGRTAVLCLLLGIIMIVAVILYITFPESLMVFSAGDVGLVTDIKLSEYLSAGFYFAAAGSILVISGGAALLLYGKTHPDVRKAE